MVQNLFEQLSTQLNFLLLAQRQMILVSAFAVSLIIFWSKEKGAPLMFLSFLLFGYAVAVGIKSSLEFSEFIKDVRNDVPLQDDEKRLVDSASTWAYFSYVLIGIIFVAIISFFRLRNLL